MCIIVAKNQGVKMPSDEIIANCFFNNPDGAGIMLAVKGKVYGFKGLMTLDAFHDKLKQLHKRFGSLNKLPVVMHFRIGTHGANIAANTHPFPVSSQYKALRKLEWTSNLGMAHNGIIQITGRHADIKAENVSDTMVFIRRMVAPISEKTDIMHSQSILDALQMAADSKLCFLDYRGNLKCLGDFTLSDGIYYSNTSYVSPRQSMVFSRRMPYTCDWMYDDNMPEDISFDYPRLSQSEESELALEIADDYGLEVLTEDFVIRSHDFEISIDNLAYAIDWMDNTLYYWSSQKYDWLPSSFTDVDVILREEDEVNA